MQTNWSAPQCHHLGINILLVCNQSNLLTGASTFHLACMVARGVCCKAARSSTTTLNRLHIFHKINNNEYSPKHWGTEALVEVANYIIEPNKWIILDFKIHNIFTLKVGPKSPKVFLLEHESVFRTCKHEKVNTCQKVNMCFAHAGRSKGFTLMLALQLHLPTTISLVPSQLLSPVLHSLEKRSDTLGTSESGRGCDSLSFFHMTTLVLAIGHSGTLHCHMGGEERELSALCKFQVATSHSHEWMAQHGAKG